MPLSPASTSARSAARCRCSSRCGGGQSSLRRLRLWARAPSPLLKRTAWCRPALSARATTTASPPRPPRSGATSVWAPRCSPLAIQNAWRTCSSSARRRPPSRSPRSSRSSSSGRPPCSTTSSGHNGRDSLSFSSFSHA
ncbi:hypothetical protein L227DRAFT_267009 [Lentinus tigrinus ALCF2SS1-6]|uniref:Uncharacterized protein n=1 Tax=Lentinus tigrinus ALCF2SS1-6 TaxID=1328759 RepID=A0A5C2SM83_9APHY|nr:hypothetical protein L227DRAFT_267009 [Lentinus tigrinus ALCF2SS1-6]